MKKTNKLKGMTLVEMIISIAVFAIMGVVLIGVGTTIDRQTKATNDLKDKVLKQSPYAANSIDTYTKSDGTSGDIPKEEVDINVSLSGVSGFIVEPATDSSGAAILQITTYGDTSVNMKGDKYSTEDVYLDSISDEKKAAYPGSANSGLNLEFIEIQPEPTT